MKTFSNSLRALVMDGILTGAWKAQNEVADVLEIPRGTFVTYLNAGTSDEGIMKKVIKQVSDLLLQLRTDQTGIDSLIQRLRRAFLRGVIHGKWRNAVECAKRLDVDGKALARALKRLKSVDTPKRRTFIEKLIQKMESSVNKGKKKKPKDEPQAPPPVSHHPESTNGLPGFLLNARNAAVYLQLMHETAVIKDTDELLTLLCKELTERFKHIASIDDLQERGRIIKKLNAAIDKLYLMIQHCLEADESSAAKHLQRQKELENS